MRQVGLAAFLSCAASLLAFQARHLLIRVSELFPTVLPSNPYFVPEHAALLYVGVPAAVTALVVLLLTPGMLFVFALGGERRVGAFLLKAFGAAYALRVVAHAALLNSALDRLSPASFITIELALDVPLAIVAVWRASRGQVAWPLAASQDRRRLTIALIIPAVLVAAMLPKFFWQDFTSDGMEAMEIGYSLTFHGSPRWPNSAGFGRVSAGMLAMAPPVHWFIQLIGAVESAARLPLALYLPILYAVLTELIEWNAARRLRGVEDGVLLLALATYAVAMCFNSTYDPYAADIASPGAAFETLTVVCLAATVLWVWQRQLGWLVLFAALGMLARPTQLVVLAGLALGIVMAGGEERRRSLGYVAVGAAVAVAVLLLHDLAWLAHVVGNPARSLGQIGRWRFLTFNDAERVLYAAVPGGLLPFLSLTLWKWQDRASRQLTVVCVSYFALFYIQAFVAMHHYVPAMIFPVVVFWRTVLGTHARWPVPLAAVVAAACLWVSLPRDFAVDRSTRAVGCRTAYIVGDYLHEWPSHSATIRERRGLETLFNVDRSAHPERDLLLMPGPLQFYAAHCRTAASAAQYLAQAVTMPPPEGMVRIGGDSVMSLFAKDTAEWRREGRNPPSTEWRSRVYATPRATLHRPIGTRAGNYQVDLSQVPLLWRLFAREPAPIEVPN